jgi:hypothetical protein
MRFVRSGIAIGAGFLVFSLVLSVLGPSMGAVLATTAGGVMAGYLTAKIASAHELLHGGAAAGLVAASILAQSAFPLGVRAFVAALAVVAISAGAWIRANAKSIRPENMAADSQRPDDAGGEERS